jgi:hypothetical protein
MVKRLWASAFAVAALSSVTLLGGDYSHLLEVVKTNWPERSKGMAICSLQANQFTLLDLVDNAKEKGISLVIVNIKEMKEMEKTLGSALNRRPDFILIIDDDTVLGSKSTLIAKVVSRAAVKGIPTIGLSVDPLKFGAVLAVAAAADAPIYVNMAAAKQLKVDLPAGAVAAPGK